MLAAEVDQLRSDLVHDRLRARNPDSVKVPTEQADDRVDGGIVVFDPETLARQGRFDLPNTGLGVESVDRRSGTRGSWRRGISMVSAPLMPFPPLFGAAPIWDQRP